PSCPFPARYRRHGTGSPAPAPSDRPVRPGPGGGRAEPVRTAPGAAGPRPEGRNAVLGTPGVPVASPTTDVGPWKDPDEAFIPPTRRRRPRRLRPPPVRLR